MSPSLQLEGVSESRTESCQKFTIACTSFRSLRHRRCCVCSNSEFEGFEALAHIVSMDKEQAPIKSVPKKFSKGRIHIPRAPKRHTPEQMLEAEQAAHRQTCSKLTAALARLKEEEQDCSNSKAVVHTLQQELSVLSAELQQKQLGLQLMSNQMADAYGVAAALDTTVSEISAKLLAQERELQQQRSAAHDLAAHKQRAARTEQELSQLQLAHGATLAKLVDCKKTANGCIAFLQQQLQSKEVGLVAAQACKDAALNDLAVQELGLQAASSQIAVLQEQLAVTQDSLEELQDSYHAAKDELAVQKAATFAAEALVTGLEVNVEFLTASLSQAQRSNELLSADLAVHKAAASTAESRSVSLQVLLQDSSSKCAELKIALDDLAQQASATASASNNRVQELEVLLQDALAMLQHLQVAKEESLDALTNIAADCLVSQATSEFTMSQQLKAADTAAKTQRDKCAIRDAEIRGYKWQLARSEASIKRLQHEVAILRQQLADAAEGAVQVKVQLQTAVWGRTAATMQAEEVDTAAQVVKQQLCVAQQKLADAEDQLFGWACAAAAAAYSADDPESSPAGAANGAPGNPAPTVLLHSNSPGLPTSSRSSRHSLCSPTESARNPLAQPHLTTSPCQQNPVSSYQEVPVSSHKEIPRRASETLEAASHSITSKPAIRSSDLYDSLNQMFKRFGLLCSGGLSKHSSSPKALDEVLVHHDPIANSLQGSQHTGTVPSHHMSPHFDKAAQGRSCSATDAVAAAFAGASGISGTAASAPLPRLSRWGSAAAGAGDGGYSAPRSSDTAGSYSFGTFTASHTDTADSSTTDLTCGDFAATYSGNHDDIALDGETTVLVVETSTGGKAGPLVIAAVTDVGAVALT